MSKGSPRVCFRCPPSLREAVRRQLVQFGRTRRGPIMTESQFIVRAIIHELAHLERSRVGRRSERRVVVDAVVHELSRLQGGCLTPPLKEGK